MGREKVDVVGHVSSVALGMGQDSVLIVDIVSVAESPKDWEFTQELHFATRNKEYYLPWIK